ncbi:MAG: prepilin-type N-terminal cleavage/methylation domain-containing protein [Candidatus Pacebacteria bacterium]|nr:prepilin-type N-terminal cleavage/methylation domain-containing protein [Candidatus Paceibacterota bacterium]MDD5013441.1 prepilin-type N-terminal cleavage/methylation domain-containing protein [Candidatus Paceibacterota bacterium]
MNKSFTLIEILVVIVVIGILSSFILVGMSSITNSATIAKGKAFANSLRDSLLMSLVSEWKLNDGTGSSTIVDSWGGKTGTLVNVPVWKTGADCVGGSCLYFDGTGNKYVSTAFSFSAPNYITVEFWIKGSINPSNWQWILDGGQSIPNGSFSIVRPVNANDIQYRYSNGTTCTLNAGYANFFNGYDNKWMHVVIAADYVNNLVKYYRNGILLSPSASMTAPIKPITSFMNFAIYATADYPFIGYFDETRIYSQLVSTFDIQQKYYSGLNRMLVKRNISNNEYAENILNLTTR